jgi:hypothetical protein
MKIVLFAALSGLFASIGGADAQTPKPAPRSAQKWDQVANIKEMATHIGNVQRAQGADKAFVFIDACYRTHSLGSTYSRPLEGCIVADILLAQALVAVINRVPSDDLRKKGMAAPEDITKTVQTRIGSAFGQYGVPATEANTFIALAKEHGTAPFMKAVFPDAVPDAPVKR